MKDSIKCKGHWKFTLKDKDGNIKQIVEKENLIVDTGWDFISDVIGNTIQPAEMDSMEIGTGTTAAAAADIDLQTPVQRITGITYNHTIGTKIFSFEGTFGAGGGPWAITEAGVFNGGTTTLGTGILLNRVVFAAINKGTSDTLDATFTFTMS